MGSTEVKLVEFWALTFGTQWHTLNVLLSKKSWYHWLDQNLNLKILSRKNLFLESITSKNQVSQKFPEKNFKIFEFSTWCASAKKFLIIFPQSMGLTSPRKIKKFCRKWSYKGVWDGSKSMTMKNSTKIADKSRDIHRINFLRPYSESAVEKTPSHKLSAILDKI